MATHEDGDTALLLYDGLQNAFIGSIQGHPILKSCIETLKKYNLIIFMEYAPYALKEYGSNIYEFNNFIKKYDYKIFDLNFKRLNQVKIKEGSSKDIVLIKE